MKLLRLIRRLRHRCLCGCGNRTAPAKWTAPRWGLVEGKPTRYLHGHNARDPENVARLRRYAADPNRPRAHSKRKVAAPSSLSVIGSARSSERHIPDTW